MPVISVYKTLFCVNGLVLWNLGEVACAAQDDVQVQSEARPRQLTSSLRLVRVRRPGFEQTLHFTR